MYRTTILTIHLGLAACLPPAQDAGEAEPVGSSTGTTSTADSGSTSRGPSEGTTESGETTTGIGGLTGGEDASSTSIAEPLDLPGECVEWPVAGCGSPSASGIVAGTTPLGEMEATLAVFNGDMTCQTGCNELQPNIEAIHMASDPAALDGLVAGGFADETLTLEVGLTSFEGPVGTPVGGTLYVTRNGTTEQTGMVTVVIDVLPTAEELAAPFDPLDAVVVTGTLTAEDTGWSVSGSFTATYCPRLNSLNPCE